ncbi:hypothetical protein BDA96_03G457500 [Sorghum bicolor]|uniref:Uncharacterized protein n=1 Tax=Sorghum bicolor TaxID=4558 RepID=A0A921RJK3_SORBI|nr:hypothetical protein BDA96_03G457500 [Sorghum bicolor]
MTLNSSNEMRPSPFWSTPSIMRRHCATEADSPRPLRTRASSAAEMVPLPSASKTRNAWRRSSSTAAASPATVAFSAANSSRLMKPSPSASASAIIRATSSSEAAWPRLSNSAASSDREIRPSPFASNLRNTRAISSSAVAARGGDPLPLPSAAGCCCGGGDLERRRNRDGTGILIFPMAALALSPRYFGLVAWQRRGLRARGDYSACSVTVVAAVSFLRRAAYL